MYPILLRLGSLELHTYAVTMALGFMAALMLANHRVEKRGIDLQKVLNMEVWLILCGLGGSRSDPGEHWRPGFRSQGAGGDQSHPDL